MEHNKTHNSIDILLLEFQNKLQNSPNIVSTTQYIRDNFDAISKIIDINKKIYVGKRGSDKVYELISNALFEDGIKTLSGEKIAPTSIGTIIYHIRKERGLVRTKTSLANRKSILVDAGDVNSVIPVAEKKTSIPTVNSSPTAKTIQKPNSDYSSYAGKNMLEVARDFDWSKANYGSPMFIFPDYIQLDEPIKDKSIDQIRSELTEKYGYVKDPNLSDRMNDNELLEKILKNPYSKHLNFTTLSHIKYDQITADIMCLLEHTHKGIFMTGEAKHDNNAGSFEIDGLARFSKNIKDVFPTKLKK